MVKAVLVRYGVKDAGFLRNALSPNLEPLGVLSLIPTANELSLAAADKGTVAAIQVRMPRRVMMHIFLCGVDKAKDETIPWCVLLENE